MPHPLPNEWITRTTETTGAKSCEERANHYRTELEKLNRNEVKVMRGKNTFSSVRGTVAHHKIENKIRSELGKPKKPLDLDPGAHALYNRIMANPKLKKKFNKQVSNAYMRFIDWWQDFEPIPLSAEKEMIYSVDGKKLKGTVDFICLIRERKLDKALKKPPRSNEYRVVLLDWKTGKKPKRALEAEHKDQISGYYYASHSTGAIKPFLKKHDYYEYDHQPYGIDVYLGGSSYHHAMYEIDQQSFFLGVELYKRAERIPVDRRRGGILREGGMGCYFCPWTDRCSTITISELSTDEFIPVDTVSSTVSVHG